MSRFKVTLEYDGTRYSGWQMQKGAKSIQGAILDSCRLLFPGSEVDIQGAGRTDSGVHARGQVAHIEVNTELPPLKIKYGLNDNLPPDISVINVETASPSFNARHDAIARSYTYQISRRRTAFGKKYVWWIKDELSVAKMQAAARLFTGLKDYRNFTDLSGEHGSTKVEIVSAEVAESDFMILFRVTGSHFLWKQVRRMAGVLVEAGRGKLNERDILYLFSGNTDLPAKLTAPPSGLFLDKVFYSNNDPDYLKLTQSVKTSNKK